MSNINNNPFGRADWWDLSKDQRVEEFIKERKKIIEKSGFALQGVAGLGGYSIGISQNPKTPYEFIATADIITPCINELQALKDLKDKFITSTDQFTVTVNGRKENLRLGLVKIEDPVLIVNFIKQFAKGVKAYFNGNLKCLYLVAFGDVDNILPFELPNYNEKAYIEEVLKKLSH